MVYHAHGYVIHSENCTSGEEIWDRNSAFSEVFFDFEKAKKFLLEQFEKLLEDIYRKDKLFEYMPAEERDIKKQSIEWRREYIDEYIDYCLAISQLTHEYGADNAEIDFTNPPKIDWYFRYNGELRTRFYVFGDKEYECRESDLLADAGTKFKVGDLVEYTDWEFKRDYPSIYVVFSASVKPSDKTEPWGNIYTLLGIDDGCIFRSGTVHKEQLHEADLRFAEKERMENCSFIEPLTVLQKIVKGETSLTEQEKKEVFGGKVYFGNLPHWRDFIKK